MNWIRLIIIMLTLCVLVLLISLLAIFIPRSKTKENIPSSIVYIVTTESTIIDITISKKYTNDQTTVALKSTSILTSNMGQNVTTALIDTVTTTGKTQVITSNKIEASTENQISYWNLDASLNQGRSNFRSVSLINRRILISGGLINATIVTSGCENYSSSFEWQITTSMNVYRYMYTLTAFANYTKALAVGTAYSIGRQTAEVFDSTTNTWILTSTNMFSARYYHTAILLGNGQILIAGGNSSTNNTLSTAEIYIPSSNSFINTSNTIIGRFLHVSTLLNDGSTVLVTGGADSTNSILSTAEIYTGGSWTRTNTDMPERRAFHAAVLLNDGNVLIAGGGNGGAFSYVTAEIYIPTARIFAAVGSMKYRRGAFTLTLLPSGKVLATGGVDWNTKTYPKVCELYDPLTRTWSDTKMLNYGRSHHQTILLNNSVLTIGGQNGSDSTRVAVSEKYYL